MDPKYEYRYASNASAIARANSLTGHGTLKVMKSHWVVQALPSLSLAH